MAILNRQNIPVLFTIILSVLVGVGSFLSGIYPTLGIIFSIFGILFGIWQLLSSEIRNRETNRYFEAQACLMADAGIGNLYLQVAKKEFRKSGTFKNIRKYLDKALQIDPNDVEALLVTANIIIKELSFNQWVQKLKNISDSSWAYAFGLVNRGIRNYPSEHKFLDLLGVLYDIAGKYSLARKCFVKSSKMRQDPYWRLLLSTSYGMSEDYDRSLKEMQKAIDEGAKGWVVEYYYGRALKACGYYREALTHLNNALSMAGHDPRILLDRQNCLHMLGHLVLSAVEEFRVSFIIAMLNPSLSARLLAHSITHITIALLTLLHCQLNC